MKRISELSNMKTNIVFMICVLLCIAERTAVKADRSSGCPNYGCLPSGTFALSSDIPDGQSHPVGVRWSALVSGRTDNKVSRLGCLSCQEGLVCVTHSGFVAVDQLQGNLTWRYDNMTSPSLPIMDIDGDVIGSDGKHIVKIEADGTVVNPVIKIYGHLNPMYSIMPVNNGLMFLTSVVNGELITYIAEAGIPEASLTLRSEVDRVNGYFLPVAQPVIFGMRAYILMEFVPDSLPLDETKAHVLGLQRLYAVDLWRRLVERIAPVWYFNFEREKPSFHGNPKPGASSSSSSSSSMLSYGNSLLVHYGTVYVSIGRPQVHAGRFGHSRGARFGDEEGMLWAIRDNGTEPEVIFKTPAPVSSLALYDVTLGHQRQPFMAERFRFYEQRRWKNSDGEERKQARTSAAAADPILWTYSSRNITGHNSRNGNVTSAIDVSQLLNLPSCRITSKVMVTRSQDGVQERLVFAVVSENAKTTSGGGKVVTNTSMPYMIAVNVDLNSRKVRLLWKVAGKSGTEIVGQIPNMLVVPPAKRGRGKGGNGGGGGGEGRKGDDDDVQVLLVATAVSDEAQFSFAVGQV